MAQKDRGDHRPAGSWVDVVFGTHNIGSLPALLDRARTTSAPRWRSSESLETFPSTLPTRRDSAYSGWVSISVGCNNTAPSASSPACGARSRTAARARSSPRSRLSSPRASSRSRCSGRTSTPTGSSSATGSPSASCCAPVARIDEPRAGPLHQPAPRRVHRRRHRRDGRDAERHAEPAHAAPVGLRQGAAGHAPLLPQRASSSASSTRSAPHPGRRDHDRHHRRVPGETEDDFQDTLGSCARPGFSSAFTFQYSSRPGTPAATMPDQVPKAVVQERFDRLIALQEEVSWAENRRLEGRGSRCSSPPARAARTRPPRACPAGPADNRLVHFAVPEGAASRDRATGHGRRDLRRAAPPRRRQGFPRAARMPSGGPPAATPGRRSGTPPCRASRRSHWVCRQWAAPTSRWPPRRRARPEIRLGPRSRPSAEQHRHADDDE